MNNKQSIFSLLSAGLMLMTSLTVSAQAPLVIAHRGASGYVPEHTIAAKAMAYAMGADYIEQDVVMSKDDHLIVLHDHHLDSVSDVQEKFPSRKREDGRYYVIDFTLEELRSLNISERYYIKNGVKKAFFPERFPIGKSRFKIHTLGEEIELIQGLNKSTGKNVGIYPEVKSPKFHLEQGKDLSLAVLELLKSYGYVEKHHKVYFQCFDIEELQRVSSQLLPALKMNVKLVQLMGSEQYYDEVTSAQGIINLAKIVDGIGPSIGMIVENNSTAGKLKITALVANAHAAGLEVHPYTFRQESTARPPYSSSYEDLLDVFINKVGVDGVFTDFTDRTVQFISANNE